MSASLMPLVGGAKSTLMTGLTAAVLLGLGSGYLHHKATLPTYTEDDAEQSDLLNELHRRTAEMKMRTQKIKQAPTQVEAAPRMRL